MAPHPMLMQVLHDDRNRRVTAALTRQSLLAQHDETPGNEPTSAPRHLGVRALAFLTMILCPRKDEAAGTPR